MDVNEQIVNTWLNLCKNQFTITNISFKVFGPKGGSNYSDIDILAVDSNNNYFDYEIKWRSVYSLSATDKETPENILNQISRKERVEKIRSIIGDNEYKRYLIVAKVFFGKTEKKKKRFINYFNENGIGIIYFEDIIKELIDAVNLKGRYDLEVLQIIRMLKSFGFLN